MDTDASEGEDDGARPDGLQDSSEDEAAAAGQIEGSSLDEVGNRLYKIGTMLSLF